MVDKAVFHVRRQDIHIVETGSTQHTYRWLTGAAHQATRSNETRGLGRVIAAYTRSQLCSKEMQPGNALTLKKNVHALAVVAIGIYQTSNSSPLRPQAWETPA